MKSRQGSGFLVGQFVLLRRGVSFSALAGYFCGLQKALSILHGLNKVYDILTVLSLPLYSEGIVCGNGN